jgi:hypothetical protein
MMNRKNAIALGVAGALALSAATPSFAASVPTNTAAVKAAVPGVTTEVRWHGGWGWGPAVGVGIGLGFAGAYYGGYGYGCPYYGYYGYCGGPYAYGYGYPAYAYAPGPYYGGYYGGWGWRHHRHWRHW